MTLSKTSRFRQPWFWKWTTLLCLWDYAICGALTLLEKMGHLTPHGFDRWSTIACGLSVVPFAIMLNRNQQKWSREMETEEPS